MFSFLIEIKSHPIILFMWYVFLLIYEVNAYVNDLQRNESLYLAASLKKPFQL